MKGEGEGEGEEEDEYEETLHPRVHGLTLIFRYKEDFLEHKLIFYANRTNPGGSLHLTIRRLRFKTGLNYEQNKISLNH